MFGIGKIRCTRLSTSRRILYSLVVIFLVGASNVEGQSQYPLLLETIQETYDRYTDTWNEESTISYAYDQTGRLINQTTKAPDPCKTDCPDYENTLFAKNIQTWAFDKNGLETRHTETNYRWQKTNNTPWVLQIQYQSTRKTSYNGDSLITDQVFSHVYPAIEYQTGTSSTYTEHYEYNNDRQEILHTTLTENISQNYQSGRLNKTAYSYQNGLLQSESETRREFSKEDTTYYYNALTTYIYTASKMLESSTSESNSNGSIYRSKSQITYNAAGQKTKDESFYWDFGTGDWAYLSFKTYEYNPSGTIKQDVTTYLNDGTNYTVTTTEYDEVGKTSVETSNLYDNNMTFIKQVYKSYYEWVNDTDYRNTTVSEYGIWSYLQQNEKNSEGNPLIYKFESARFELDSSFRESSLYQDLYEYDNAGHLINRKETRVAYDADSLISEGCCGWLFEAESVYSNRCDGAPLTSIRTQNNYVPGTESEFYSEPLVTRQLNKYTNSVCAGDEEAPTAMTVYPNPSSGTINIASDILAHYNTRLSLVSADGKLISTMTSPVSSSFSMDLTGIAPGIYILRLENESAHDEQKVVVLP